MVYGYICDMYSIFLTPILNMVLLHLKKKKILTYYYCNNIIFLTKILIYRTYLNSLIV